jgi:hypothetical protein
MVNRKTWKFSRKTSKVSHQPLKVKDNPHPALPPAPVPTGVGRGRRQADRGEQRVGDSRTGILAQKPNDLRPLFWTYHKLSKPRQFYIILSASVIATRLDVGMAVAFENSERGTGWFRARFDTAESRKLIT